MIVLSSVSNSAEELQKGLDLLSQYCTKRKIKTRKRVYRTRMPPPNAIQKKGLHVTVTGIR